MEKQNDRIYRLRTERKLSQQQVADACQVSRVAVTKWESGQTENLKLGNLQALAKLFGMPVGEMLDGGHGKGSIRSAEEPPATPYAALSADELQLVQNYRQADVALRKAVRTILSPRARHMLNADPVSSSGEQRHPDATRKKLAARLVRQKSTATSK